MVMKKKQLILGTRGSRLALWQANFVKKQIEAEHPDTSVVIKVIKTTGDKIKKIPLTEIGGKALFLKEIEESLLEEKVDLGVHSLKDVPTDLPAGLELAAVLKREDPRDVFVSKKYDSILHLPKKARIGTGSFRRRAQLKNFRPDLDVVPLRGNVETRLKKILSEDLDGIILAAAGLVRLGMKSKITEYLPPSLMLPAVGQGAMCIEIRAKDVETRRQVEFLNDMDTAHAVEAERSFLKTLEGDCQSPIAAFAEVEGQSVKITGMLASVEGRDLVRDRLEGNIREAANLGEKLARQLLGHGGRDILRVCREKIA